MKTRHMIFLFGGIAFLPFLLTSLSEAKTNAGQTFTVTATADVVDALPGDGVCETASGNGVCTLRAAIMEANAQTGVNTILLPEATYTLTIPGVDEDESATGDLDITESLTILGAVDVQSDIDANGFGDRVLDVHTTADLVTVSWVVFTGGSAPMGGGIYSKGRLELSDVVVFDNEADNGGGIFSSQALTLTDVIVVQNTALNHGGGALIMDELTAQNCHFMNNDAGESGGGIMLDDGTEETILGSTFSYNSANKGGGIYNEGALSLKDSEVYKNLAISGGGIANYSPGNLILEHVSIYENIGYQYAGGITNQSGSIQGHAVLFNLNSAGIAGAIHNSFGGEIDLSQVILSNNSSEQIGGAIANGTDAHIVLTESAILSNTSNTSGGGMANEGIAELVRVTIHNNQAENGGGIRNYNLGLISLENSTISGNDAVLNGGGIYNEGRVFAYHSTITSNIASSDPISPSGTGGGVYNVEGVKFIFQDTILFANYRRAIFLTDNDCYGTLISQHYNLVGTLGDCALEDSQGLDLIGVDPLLGALADNGGLTLTRALQPGSPAIDAANPAGCFGIGDMELTSDQRGHLLPWDGDADGTPHCDIGAYEAPLAVLYLPMTVK